MKRLWIVFLLCAIVLLLCSCKTKANKNADVTLTFITESENISVVLEDADAERVAKILDGNYYNSVMSVPSCGFSKDISLKVGNRTFAIARDTCRTIQDCGNLRFFSVSQEDMDYIHSLFARYGGHFPCI